MNNTLLMLIAVVGGGGIVAIFGSAMLIKSFYIKVSPGQVLINNKTGKEIAVSFTGGLVMPIIHRAEVMDISVKALELDRRGKEGLICKDNIRADIKVAFFVRVNPVDEDVINVAKSIGCARASHEDTMQQLFSAKFSEALKTVGYRMNFVELYTERQRFKDEIVDVIGKDLNGYKLEDVAIDFLEQTPVSSLDPENTMDAEGIRAITQITANKNVETNRLRNEESKSITKQNVEAREAILALERQQATAEAAQAREVANVRAREMAETQRVQAEETLKARNAQIRTEEELAIAAENKDRQIQVAQKNRERVIGIETERVLKDRSLEAISREREVELQRIEKEKLLEQQRKEIADVIRGRVSVERGVAEEEERIKDVRALAEAKRLQVTAVTAAETEAQEKLVKDIKSAEAAEKAATHLAKQKLIQSDADLEAADRHARASLRQAEGDQALAAAAGLAEVKVREADAVAVEKRGLVEARLIREKLAATAEGEKLKGMAAADVAERQAEALRKQGEAEAEMERVKLLAKAQGEEQLGLAHARVKEAEAGALEKTGFAQANAVEKQGLAEAVAIREKGSAEAQATQQKMTAEAKGIADKMTAMKAMEGAAKEHEEFRLRLENERLIQIEALGIQQKIAEAQAQVLGKAFENAKIDIVGGDGAFFDRFVNAVSLGKSVDGFMASSKTAATVLDEYTKGERSLPSDVKDVLSRPAVSSAAVRDLSVATLLNKLAQKADGEEAKKLQALVAKAKELGLGVE